MTTPMSLADVTEAAIAKLFESAGLCPKCGLPRMRTDEAGSFEVSADDPAP